MQTLRIGKCLPHLPLQWHWKQSKQLNEVLSDLVRGLPLKNPPTSVFFLILDPQPDSQSKSDTQLYQICKASLTPGPTIFCPSPPTQLWDFFRGGSPWGFSNSPHFNIPWHARFQVYLDAFQSLGNVMNWQSSCHHNAQYLILLRISLGKYQISASKGQKPCTTETFNVRQLKLVQHFC